jgi:spermidine synthase
MIKAITTFALLGLVLGMLSGSAQADTTIYTERSLYRNISVTENSETRCIRFSRQSNLMQSCFSFQNPDRLLFECNKMILGALYLRPNPRRILMVGLGGGTLASAFSRLLPGTEIDVVEIDPAMVRVAKQYFNFRPSPKVHVYIEDGRVYVKRAMARGEKYDLVILDAFDELYIPAHMLTRQFLSEVQKVMTDDAVLASNTEARSNRYDSESMTYQTVFGSFFNLKEFWKNSRVIITKQDGLPSEEVLARNAKALAGKLARYGVESSYLLPLFSSDSDWDKGAPVLTDKYTPF